MKYSFLLEKYINGIALLNIKLSSLTENDLNYRPDKEEAWTIKEHIIHLVDSEVNGFIRCKSIIAQPNTECYVMDEDLWTRNIRRKNEDINKYIAVFGLIRNIVYDLVKDEAEENRTKDYFIRTYKDETNKITIEKCLELYCNHLEFHLEYIDKIKNNIDESKGLKRKDCQ